MTRLLRLLKTEGDSSWCCSASAENLKNLSVCLCRVAEQCEALKGPVFKVWDCSWHHTISRKSNHSHTASSARWKYLWYPTPPAAPQPDFGFFEPQVMLPKSCEPQSHGSVPHGKSHTPAASPPSFGAAPNTAHASSSFFQLENCREWATITIIVRSILEIIFLLIQAPSCCASEDTQLLSPEG